MEVIDKIFRGVGVDAGIILIADYDFYKKYHGRIDKENRDIKKFKLLEGKYHVEWDIPIRPHCDGEGTLYVTSGLVVVSDPCYVVGEAFGGAKKYAEWDKVLKDTNFFKKTPRGVVLLDKMGGDGTYRVYAKFIPLD